MNPGVSTKNSAKPLERHPYWGQVALLPEEDLKEALITGYNSGKQFSPHHYHMFKPGRKARSILDFGCAIGRNFSTLKPLCEQLVAYDIPEMIQACRRYGDCSEVELQDDWQAIRRSRFDVAVMTLVIQHIDDPDILRRYLTDLSDICDFLYVSSRCWIDGDGCPNVLRAIKDTGTFEYIKGTLSQEEALALSYPDETHLELLLRTRNRSRCDRFNEKLFDIERMEYKPNGTRLDITVAQLFTANYDHWAYKVLENKRAYCDRHGYRFSYRRGIYPHAADRHPSWHRIPLILALFEQQDVEWVFWSDIDSIIMRMDVRLEWLIGEHDDRDLIIPNQGAGLHLGEPVENCLCFGQFFLRNTEWSRQFLQELWEFPGKSGYKRFLVEESWEQEAVNYIYNNNLLAFDQHSLVVSNRRFNSFYHTQYLPGDFLIHFAGEAARGEGRREKLIDQFLPRVAL